MDIIKAKINEIAASAAEKNNLFLIDVVLRGHEQNRVIEIFFDAEESLNAEICAALSREIQDEIERLELFKGRYRLEVSSPGVDRPLKFAGQYKKHIDRNFEIVFMDESIERKIRGKLKLIEGSDFYFETEKKELIKINFNSIKKAKVNISFS